ncbi:MAG: hypothetical protein VKN72_26540 [Nostocales cyanobacterium 94392]|nr:hypothetical protein [Nostocales cyanobacterium 94392]
MFSFLVMCVLATSCSGGTSSNTSADSDCKTDESRCAAREQLNLSN